LSPIRLSVFSLAPVHAAAAPKSPMIEVPWLAKAWADYCGEEADTPSQSSNIKHLR
jgi:hypothetical protein